MHAGRAALGLAWRPARACLIESAGLPISRLRLIGIIWIYWPALFVAGRVLIGGINLGPAEDVRAALRFAFMRALSKQ